MYFCFAKHGFETKNIKKITKEMKKKMKSTLAIIAMSLGIIFLLSTPGFSSPCTAAGSIVSVRNTSVGQYEYVRFKVKLPVNAGFNFAVSTATPPFIQDPSGNTITVSGSKFKKIRFENVFWTCTISEQFSLPKTAIKGIKQISQFEGIVEYVIGRRKASLYIATTSITSGGFKWIKMKFKK